MEGGGLRQNNNLRRTNPQLLLVLVVCSPFKVRLDRLVSLCVEMLHIKLYRPELQFRIRSSLLSNCISCIMRCSYALLNHACRITLFTRPACGLCDEAKLVLARVQEERPFIYKEFNVMEAGHHVWRRLYQYDTPVVSLSDLSLRGVARRGFYGAEARE